jgi:hypothetical protein
VHTASWKAESSCDHKPVVIISTRHAKSRAKNYFMPFCINKCKWQWHGMAKLSGESAKIGLLLTGTAPGLTFSVAQFIALTLLNSELCTH